MNRHVLMATGMELQIAHLYAHFLNIYGDRGNIITMVQRARWRGIEVNLTAIAPGDKIDPDTYDLYFIGGGQDKQQEIIAGDLQTRRDCLESAVLRGAVILSVCGGYQLLGHYYRPFDGPELRGISLIDAYTVAGKQRMIGNVVVRRNDGSTLVGFENHSGKTFLGAMAEPLGTVLSGHGNNGEDGLEGARQGTVFGTYLHGSLLPKNPHFADELIALAVARRHGSVSLPVLDDSVELAAHKAALSLPT